MDNPFRAPESDFDPDQVELDAAAPPFPYHRVSLKKLIVFSLLTFNLYHFYWFYKQWQAQKRAYNELIWPIPRAIFLNIFSYFIFRRIELSALSEEMHLSWTSGWVFLVYFLWGLAGYLPDPLGYIVFLGVLPLIPVQESINQLFKKTAPNRTDDDHFTTLNWVFLAVLIILWVLAFTALFSQ